MDKERDMIDRDLNPPEPTIFVPDGLTVINEIPHETAEVLLEDQAYELDAAGKRFLQSFFDLAMQGKRDACVAKIIECATEAGETDYAQSVWRDMQ